VKLKRKINLTKEQTNKTIKRMMTKLKKNNNMHKLELNGEFENKFEFYKKKLRTKNRNQMNKDQI
jgi:hypothetical protein